MLRGQGTEASVSKRVDMIRDQNEDTSSEYEKEKLEERLAKLKGGVAVIKVGGSSEVEVAEKKDRVTDALNATRAAVEEGVVPGGGMALLYSSQILKELEVTNEVQKVGLNILRKALEVPAKTIAANAGLEGAVIVGKLLEGAKGDTGCRQGFNAQEETYVDMFDAGIIDPVKVCR